MTGKTAMVILEAEPFNIAKAILNYEKRGTQVSGYPVYDLYAATTDPKEKTRLEKDVMKLYGTVTGKVLTGDIIRKGYEL